MTTQRRRTAVVGSGVAGLTAAHILGRARDVTLHEADERVGGHAHTHDLISSDGRTHRVDSGFIVHNRRTYPHLLRLFDELGVATQESEMSMSVRCEGCGLEYAGARGAVGLFARPGVVLRGAYLRMLTEVPRFHRAARSLLAQEAGTALMTLGEFAARRRFSPYFTAHFLTPMVSAVWSCDPVTALLYPARYLFRFLDHHGMLSTGGSPVWRTVTGGSREYVDRIAEQVHSVRTSTPVRAVRRHSDGVEIVTEDGATEEYDEVVVATHPDQALRMLADPTEEERRTLGAFRYSRNPTLLHTDTTLLPRSRGAAASRRTAALHRGDGPRHRGAHGSAHTAARQLRHALRRDPAAVAGTVRGAGRPGRRAGLRRDLPPHVDLLPRLLRGRIPVRLSRCAADSPDS